MSEDLDKKELLSAEARRQSLLASQQTHPDDEFWSQLADDKGWEYVFGAPQNVVDQ